MFRNVRKKTNEISIEEAKELLKTSRRGVLALNGDDGYPYAIPVNYFYIEDHNQIIFHGSKAGHKADSLKRSDKICFTVYAMRKLRISIGHHILKVLLSLADVIWLVI